MDVLFIPVALLIGVVLLIAVAVVMRLRRGTPAPHDVEAEVLRARYAIGELPREEYERRRQELEQRARRSA